jgi:hypothetical protein
MAPRIAPHDLAMRGVEPAAARRTDGVSCSGDAERAHRGPLFIISGSEEPRVSLRVRARPMSLASGVSRRARA